MEKFQKLVSNIIIGIDRIQFGIPRKYYSLLISSMDLFCNHIDSYDGDDGYWRDVYKHYSVDVVIKNKIKKSWDMKPYDRVYLTVSDPNQETQNLLDFIFYTISQEDKRDFYEIKINQIEISYDFFSKTEDGLTAINYILNKHINIKYSRPESYYVFKTTTYTGRNGNVNHGAKGIRRYPKHENGRKFVRFEMQFNRPYLKEIGLKFGDLPLNPLHFHVFNFVEFLGDFSKKGIKNLSKKIVNLNGTSTSSPNFHEYHKKMIVSVGRKILSGRRGPKKAIPAQLTGLKQLNKKHDIKSNYKRYFPVLHFYNEFITCLSDIGYKEVNCTKRLICCRCSQ